MLDREWAHIGRPIEDLAWCEWIVRMHHPQQTGALGELFAEYGVRPTWVDRKAAMLTRCQGLIDFSERWEPGGVGVGVSGRARATAGWSD